MGGYEGRSKRFSTRRIDLNGDRESGQFDPSRWDLERDRLRRPQQGNTTHEIELFKAEECPARLGADSNGHGSRLRLR
jgi:hypothetical protein